MAIPQDILNVEAVLKNDILPFWQNTLTTTSDILYEKFAKPKLKAVRGEFGTRIGIGGGFGMSEERHATPEAFAPIYNKFKFNSKDAYCDIKVSEKVLRLARDNSGAFLDTFMDEVNAQHEAAKWNCARMIYGDGTGVLATATDAGTAGTYEDNDGNVMDITTFTVDSTNFVIEGLTIDVYASGATTVTEGNAKHQIIAVDHTAKTVTVAGSVTVASGSFITAQGSYKREFTGLKAIFDPTATSIYGVKKSVVPSIVPHTVDAKNEISNVLIHNAVRTVNRQRNGKINMLIFGDDAFTAYLEMLQETNVHLPQGNNYRSGFATLKQVVDNSEIELYNSQFVPSDEVWGIDTTMFELRETGWDYVQTQGASIFTLMPGTSVHRALLADYGELICKHPGTCVRITNANGAA